MDDTLVEKIRMEKALPLIGVIGATMPTPPYTQEVGFSVGCALREYVEKAGGTIFTGGVDGVGVDTYIGVIQFCIETASRQGRMLDDHFFALIPKHDAPQAREGIEALFLKRLGSIPYEPPAEYAALGHLTPRGHLDCVYAGNDMGERRTYVAAIADALVVVNGGGGTMDEAYKALQHQKQVIALPYTGGAAAVLGQIKDGRITPRLATMLGKLSIAPETIDHKYILTASNTADLTRQLHTLRQRG